MLLGEEQSLPPDAHASGLSSAPPSALAGDWRAVHVYYYDEDKDDLLLSAIGPLFARLSGVTSNLHFVRHWRGGPHLRLVARASPELLPSVLAAIERAVGRYLAARPSRAAPPREDDVLAQHRRLAEMERDPAPLLPLRPDNTVLIAEHDRRVATLGGEAGADLLADFYDRTNPLTFRMLEQIRAGRSRPALALSLMLATGHSFFGSAPGLATGFVSFRSHADAFLEASTHPARTRARFDRDYEANRAKLVGLVRQVMETLDHRRDGGTPFVSEWIEALGPFWLRGGALLGSGLMTLSEPTGIPRPDRLHRATHDTAGRRRGLLDDLRFKQYRLMLSYTYLHLARLGVMAYDRFRLCHLAARATEEALGVDARAMARRLHARYPSLTGET